LTFSVIAFGDAFLIFDPYPGFGSLYTRVDKAHMRYRQAKEALIENLEDIRNNAIETMQDANRDLSLRRGEHDAIIQGKERLNQLFSAYQDHLERTVNNLLMMYRGANTRARTDGQVPTHFTKRYTMDRIPLPALQGLDSAREDLRRSIADAQGTLDQQVNSIHREFEATLVTYKQIDDMVGRNADVSPQIQFA
jgi:hypothetical protein